MSQACQSALFILSSFLLSLVVVDFVEYSCAEADSSCVFTDDKSYIIDAENLIGCTETDSEGHGRGESVPDTLSQREVILIAVILPGATTGSCKFSDGPLTVVCPNTDSQLYVFLDPDMDKSKNKYKKAGNKKVQAYWTSNEASVLFIIH